MSERAAPPPLNPLSRRNPLAPVYIAVFLYSVGEAALHVLVSPYLSQRMHVSATVIGVVVAVFGTASLLTRFPVGASYRVSRARSMLVVGGILSAGAFALVPLVSGALPFAALMAVDGVGWSIATTTQLAVLVAARPAGITTASAMGWYAGFTGLGHTPAGAAAGFIADRLGFDAAFFMLAALPAIATLVMFAAMPEREPSAEQTSPPKQRARSWWELIRLPAAVWAGALLMFDINFVNGLVTTFQPVLALGAGLTLTQIGVLASLRSFASSFVRLGSGVMFARSSGRRLTTPLIVLGAAAVILIPSAKASFLLSAPLFLAIGLSRGLLRVTGSAHAFEGIPDDDRYQGMTASLLHAGLDLGKLTGPLLGGAVAGLAGLETMFRVLPVVLLCGYALLEILATRSAHKRGRPAPVRQGPPEELPIDLGP
jgi:MFS transporter, DHA1 family, multidrug resistance protein